jgi:hypothetical protein
MATLWNVKLFTATQKSGEEEKRVDNETEG